MKREDIRKMVIAAMLLAIGYMLPFLTMQIKTIGNMFLPMHLPVMLAGFILGWQYGLAVGFILPVTRSLLFGMPQLYPSAIAMSFELATYGVCIGILYWIFGKKGILAVYAALIPSMLIGRAVWGMAMIVLMKLNDSAFAFKVFLTQAFANAFPGIILQLILIPAIMLVLDKTRLVRFGRTRN